MNSSIALPLMFAVWLMFGALGFIGRHGRRHSPAEVGISLAGRGHGH